MSRVRHNTPGIRLRMNALRQAAHAPAVLTMDQGRECAAHPLGERLGIAAVYAGRGDVDAARASALLLALGLDDTPGNRRAVLRGLAQVRHAAQRAIDGVH